MIARMDTWDIASLDVQPHSPAVLRSDDETRAIAINLPGGDSLRDHQVHERAWLVVAEGEIEVQQGAETASGGPGLLVHFEPNERHEVRATHGLPPDPPALALAGRGASQPARRMTGSQ